MTMVLRQALRAACLLALSGAAACSGPTLADKTPPAVSSTPTPPAPPSPPRLEAPNRPLIESTPLLGGPQDAIPMPGVATMQPVPNPEDMTPSQRAEVYGRAGSRAPAHSRGRPQHHAGPALIHGPQARHTAQPKTAPAARPTPPIPVAKAPAPAARPAVAKPTAAPPLATTPKAAANGFPQTVAQAVASSLKLTIPPLKQGQSTIATLSLPASMFAQLQTEARKHGIETSARMIEIQAVLSADDFDIKPQGSQSVLMAPDESATFNWQVTPKTAGPGSLKTHLAIVFKDGSSPQTVAVEFNTPVGTKGGQAGPSGTTVSSENSAEASPPTQSAAATQTGLWIFGLLAFLLVAAFGAAIRRATRSQKAKSPENEAD